MAAPRIDQTTVVNQENWEQIKDIFNRALELPAERRAGFLSAACAGDDELRAEVETLLASFESSENLFERPAVGAVADLFAEAENAPFKTGQQIAHYEILRLLGAGGMGEVYLARDTKLNRRVALKFLPADAVGSNTRKRFLREAQTAAALEHPNICGIYEIAESDGQTFIAMQYVEGETLAEKLRRARLSLPQTIEIAAQIADALAEAHSRGIVHRDIKPANIIVSARGTVKVLDFGLAKLIEQVKVKKGEKEKASNLSKKIPSPLHLFSPSHSLTTPGLVMGTAAYMSPEQARGLAVDARTDVWSLGVVLYEMLTGKPPFAGDTTSDIIAAILRSEPAPLAAFDANVPEELQHIVTKSLAKNLIDRYDSAAEMLDDLRRAQKQLETVFERPTVPNFKITGSGDSLTTDEILPQTNVETAENQSAVASPHRRRWVYGAPATIAAALVLGFGGYQFYTTNSLLPQNFRQTTTAANKTSAARRAVALVGFKDMGNRTETAWLSPALAEMLSTELAAGEKLRIVPQQNVARMKNEIAMTDADSLTPEVLKKIWANLNAELIVSGSYLSLTEKSGERIRLDVRVVEAATAETVASVAETGTRNELFELVARVGARLRESLGAGFLNEAEANSLRTSLPANAEAARLYAEGRERFNNFDFLAARDLLRRAVAADDKFPLSHLSLAAALQKLGEDAEAKTEAKRAFELSGALRREEKLAVEAFYRDISGERDRAIEIYKTLFDFFPDNLEYGLLLAGAQNRAGNSADALATIENLRKLPAPVSEDPRIDLTFADAAESLSDYQNELNAARAAADKGLARNSSLLVAEARYYEGWALWNLGDNPAALRAYDEARRIYQEAGRRKSVADILNVAAVVHWKQGEFDKALRIYEECLAIMRETGSRVGEAAVLNNIANVYGDRDQLQNARKYYEDALRLEREIGIKSRICIGIFNLAAVVKKQGDLPKSKRLYEDALALARETGRKTSIAIVLQELAEIYYFKNDVPAARAAAEESLAIAREIKRRTSEAYALQTLGRIELAANNASAARENLEQSLAIRKELGEENAIAESQMYLARLALAENRAADAVFLAQPAAEIFAKRQAVANEAETRATLALAHLATGETDAARGDIAQSEDLAEKSENKLAKIYVRMAQARVFKETERQAEAARILRQTVAEADKIGLSKKTLANF